MGGFGYRGVFFFGDFMFCKISIAEGLEILRALEDRRDLETSPRR
jgi:hypothetical protein